MEPSKSCTVCGAILPTGPAASGQFIHMVGIARRAGQVLPMEREVLGSGMSCV